ncbi:MAG: tRNA (adenosine(37)-N6)-threonylcarbamoyltransferase complex ATPase subunit type 1 TsaE [Microbacteriaceae bacterium]|nr:tRNA (adenosine(37)-N6)-threonylcarbamoyltransferase complex ATPase subunit type 1 TsaE [Cryobacterium sp.]MCC6376425.1 tRNA (adenosine(37)-N6)-threonylcarbamoyltransferase complex ATPase subunit type 1 TsaE [Microbacteriaceae bacterium]
MKLKIQTSDEMERLGAKIASALQPGDLVGLVGELGAGKTTLTRGIGRALGIRGTVSSPTFVIARTHPSARGNFIHVDAYRLSSPAELDDLDLDFAGSIVVVEWAKGMIESLADSWLEVSIERATGHSAVGNPEEDTRFVDIIGHGPRFENFRLEA